MKASKQCIQLIKKYEGCRLTAYKCPAGVYTIGYGHTSGVTPGLHITQEQAEKFLLKDLERFEKAVSKYDHYNFNQNEFDALVSFAFNVGGIRELTKNGYRSKEQIANAIPLYNKANGKVLSGLKKRREEERKLFLTPTINGPLKDINTIVNEVIDNVWGIGNDRKKNLEKAGYDYKAIQALVNKRLKEQKG